MPLYEVTYVDQTKKVFQVKSKIQLLQLKHPASVVKVEKAYRCKECKKAIATEHQIFCKPCWSNILEEFRKELGDNPMTQKDFEEYVLAFFV